jgi:hypothetical protein
MEPMKHLLLPVLALSLLSAPALAWETLYTKKRLDFAADCSQKQLLRFMETSPSEPAKTLVEAAFDACNEYWRPAIDAWSKELGPPSRSDDVFRKIMRDAYIQQIVPIVLQKRARDAEKIKEQAAAR